jgi:hypothetical protein
MHRRSTASAHGLLSGSTTFKSLYTCHGLNFAGAWPDPVLPHQVQLRFFVNCYYCILGINKVGYIVIRIPQPDYRKSKFGLHRLIHLNLLYLLLHDEARILIFDDPPEETNANVPTDRPLQICETIFFASTNFIISKYDLHVVIFYSTKCYYFKMAIYLPQKLVLYLIFYLFDHIVRCVVGAYFWG